MQLFTVRLRNEPGTLAQVAEALAQRGVDIRAIGGGGVGDAGIAALVTDNDSAAREALSQANCEYEASEAIVTDMEDRPGALAAAARALADAGVNVTGLVILQSMGDQARLAFGVDDAAKAREALGSAAGSGMSPG
jgi:hypothetical protein